MSKEYQTLATQIIALVGGKENVANVYHCQTRLRFTLVDNLKADTEALEKLDGVTKVIINAGQYQIVIGTHVADVFEEIEKLVEISQDTTTQEKKGIFDTIIDFVAGTFQPIIPALSGAGMVKAVLALLVVFNVITTDSQTYYMLNVFADGVFYFLPILIAFTQAQKLKCNPILAAGVAAMLLHPNWSALVTAGDAVNFFNVIPFTLASYGSSVIPIILIIFVQSYVEKFLNKHIPKSINIVFVPMLTFLIMGTLAFSVLGPIGAIVGNYLATVFTFLAENASWAPALIIGTFLPIMVMFGIHNGVAPLGIMQMSQLGYDSIFGPGCVCSNMAQATAGAVVAFVTKDKTTKETAIPGSITAYMGITEPLLYGVNLPKRYPLIASMIGGGLGGLYAGLTHAHRFATGSSGLPAVLLYIGDNTMTYFYNIIIAIVISIISTAIITFVLAKHFEKEETTDNLDTTQAPVITGQEVMSPLTGEVLPIEKAEDEVFASKVMGDGVVILPETTDVYAPFDGTIATLFPTKHAIGLVSDKGAEILIHIGINTVDLNGEGFKAFVKQGDSVTKGDKLISFDKVAIENAGYSSQTMVIITNGSNYNQIIKHDNQFSQTGDLILELEK
ncbi:beta-glucoside-specific PTS transporter subunit IIABC [Streptococcus gallolyticus subsp. gallolyticus]|uniref:beta-glucoside-specific PTS transporter subunit IIABC n=1 Tax=Streptococcus gallolyticus TaxID=315405 RepID=UPI000201B490|nr:beta-glucoside-specific PTS transporter subunit IIABC [Streptococcus gallolyticus]MCF1633956.1 beta-glucoside-specific PTS transporter subunit IIABC [Streptococcus gallolyticus]MCY7157459.1 beta-glucoside-specific PTS transporter subunit IIABC [Streptococcus gallolyticus subsp. gallolyticus]WAW99420.1 beta-glucoside-specific PTS transporter subunit IIABC [Streptococcus gallolyticus]CBZ47568.1 PTS system, beta-glucosides-specific IIA component [Streptococcus gallolyticus subsp. gallolyticus A